MAAAFTLLAQERQGPSIKVQVLFYPIIDANYDVLCDEGEAYARKLLEAGVRVTAVRYHGTIHDFNLI